MDLNASSEPGTTDARASEVRPWRFGVPDPVLLAERQGRWSWPWVVLGTAVYIALALAFVGATDELQSWLARRTGTTDEYVRSGQSDVVFAPGNFYTFLNFTLFGLALMLAALPFAWLHGRQTPDFFVRYHGRGSLALFLKAAAGLLLVSLLGSALEYARNPASFALRASIGWDYLKWLPIAAAVLLIQTLGEEVAFRGYLLRIWGAVIPFRPLVTAAVILGFTLLHTTNSDFVTDYWFSFIIFIVGEFVYYWALFRTGSIVTTWGLHFANNLSATVLLVTVPGTSPDMALIIFTDPVLAAGGSRLTMPMAYIELIGGQALLFTLFMWQRSPFHLPPAPLPEIAAPAPPEPAIEPAPLPVEAPPDEPPPAA
jgi:membrane protease YdiL (CAAX protease family)